MDITWAAIGKIMVGCLATYVLLPAALILRDYILWQLIDAYILNDKLRKEIRNYALLADNWNKNFAGSKCFDEANIDFQQYLIESQKLSNKLQVSKQFIDRKSQFLKWLLKYYKQDSINPIGEWKKQAKDEIEKRLEPRQLSD